MDIYYQCKILRTNYLKESSHDGSYYKVKLLSKIMVIAFTNKEQLDTIPTGVTVDVNCSDIAINSEKLKNYLNQILFDLGFQKFDVWDYGYHINRVMHFTVRY